MEFTLAANTRQERGKNEARRLRVSGRVPAVVYGGEEVDSVAVSVDPKSLLRILHSESGVNTLIDLKVDDGDANQVLVKDFQVDPISDELLHVDFYRLAMDKKIIVNVPVTLVGEAVGVKVEGGLLDFITREVQVECLPADIPEHLEADVSQLNIGEGIRLRELVEGVEWTPISELDTLLVNCTPPKVEEEETAAEETEVEGAVPEDGQGAESEAEKKGEGDDSAGGGES